MIAVAITAKDIAIYRRYDGDLDGLSRSADCNAGIPEAVWRDIDDLRQRAFMEARGLGSEAFCRELRSDLAILIANEQALIEFRSLVDADLKRAADDEI